MATNNILAIKQIATDKPAGSYFIVTDNSKIPATARTSNLRLFFINSQFGLVNTVVQFQRGDVQGFESVFGKNSRISEKRGNFSHQTVIDALAVDDVLVCNLRAFDSELDTINVIGLNPNKQQEENIGGVVYTNMFNTNGFYSISPKKLVNEIGESCLLNFANVGDKVVSTFVVASSDVSKLTSKGNETLEQTSIEFEDFPALVNSPNTKFKDTFVDVYMFNNEFNPLTVSTNPYFGHLFNANGLINYADLDTLKDIPEAGFLRKITGTTIPNVNNERDLPISIDTLINLEYIDNGLVCYINDDLFELDDYLSAPLLNTNLIGYYNPTTGALVDGGNYLSHRLQTATAKSIDLGLIAGETELVSQSGVDLLTFTGTDVVMFLDPTKRNKVLSIRESGIMVGDTILGTDPTNILTVLSIDIIEENSNANVVGLQTYTKIELTLSGSIGNTVDACKYTRQKDTLRSGKVLSSALYNYTPRPAQFCNGTAASQKSVLDVMNSPAIVRGCKSVIGLSYIVDCFKSFVEPNYKYQFNNLAGALDEGKKFVTVITNEPFMEDLDNSVNPSFSSTPNGIFDYKYLELGGNPQTSTIFLTKPSAFSEKRASYISRLDGRNEKPNAGLISNLYVAKTNPWDVVANTSGYIDGVGGIAFDADENERKFMEMFRMNPIILTERGYTIYGNFTNQKEETSLLQISNSELLNYIKRSLLSLSIDDNFVQQGYSNYVTSESTYKSFMSDLVMAGAIQPEFVCTCNTDNNTAETEKLRVKNVYIEYTAIGYNDKTIFSLNLL